MMDVTCAGGSQLKLEWPSTLPHLAINILITFKLIQVRIYQHSFAHLVAITFITVVCCTGIIKLWDWHFRDDSWAVDLIAGFSEVVVQVCICCRWMRVVCSGQSWLFFRAENSGQTCKVSCFDVKSLGVLPHVPVHSGCGGCFATTDALPSCSPTGRRRTGHDWTREGEFEVWANVGH